MSDLRRQLEEILFPELANMMSHNRDRLQFGDDAEGQIRRIAELVASELREVADWQPNDVESRADEWAICGQNGV